MKPNKALKRISKIEAQLFNVIDKYSDGTPELREALNKAKSAVAEAKEAVASEASSPKAKPSRPKRSKKAGAPQNRTDRAAGKVSTTRRAKAMSAGGAPE